MCIVGGRDYLYTGSNWKLFCKISLQTIWLFELYSQSAEQNVKLEWQQHVTETSEANLYGQRSFNLSTPYPNVMVINYML